MQTLTAYKNLDPDKLYWDYPNGSLTFFYVPNSGNLYAEPYPKNHQEMLEDDDLFDDVYGDVDYNPNQREELSSRGQALKLTNCLLGRIGAVGEDFVISFWSNPPKNYLNDFLVELFKKFPAFWKNKDKIIIVTPEKTPYSLSGKKAKANVDTLVSADTDKDEKKFKIKNNLYSLQDLQRFRASFHTKDVNYDKAKEILCSPEMDKYPELNGYKPSNCTMPSAGGNPWRKAAIEKNVPYVYSYGENFREFLNGNEEAD